MVFFPIERMIQLLIFILPAYVANAAPVVFGTGASKMPIDFRIKFIDRKRLLGGGKTWPGFFVGILSGTIVAAITSQLMPFYPAMDMHISVGFMLSLGTMVGDTLGSFIKRRFDIKHGKPAFLLDQLAFLLVAIAFVLPWRPEFLDWAGFAFLLIATVVLHSCSNVLAHRLGLKKVPW